jgi:hypothetical protein
VVLHQQVDVIFFTVALHHRRLEVIGHTPEVIAQSLNGIAIEHAPSVFGHKDQMCVHGKTQCLPDLIACFSSIDQI